MSSKMASHAPAPACDFVKKLYRILEDKSVQRIVSWAPLGDRFVVRDLNEFTRTILPRVFKHSNFASFVRQLNKYDFHKIKNIDNDDEFGEQNWVFHHPNFHIDGRDDLENIKRKPPAQRQAVKATNADGEISTRRSSTHWQRSLSPHTRHPSPYQPTSDSDYPQHHRPDSLHAQLSTLQNQLSALQAQLASLASSHHTLSAQLCTVSETQATLVTECATLRQDVNAMRQIPPDSQPHSSLQNPYPVEVPTRMNEVDFSLGNFDFTAVTSSSSSTQSPVAASTSASSPGTASVISPSADAENLNLTNVGVADESTESGDVFFAPLKSFDNDVLFQLDTAGSSSSSWVSVAPSAAGAWMREDIQPETEQGDAQVATSHLPLPLEQFFRSATPSFFVGIPGGDRRPVSPALPGWMVPPHVLLVDDDIVSRRLSSRILQVFGCTTDVAEDGVGALTKMNLEKYDLVLMDIMMPNLDGVTATSLIRKFDHLTPIISMTSNSTPRQIMTYYSSGMNDILSKPVTKANLLGVLEKHLIHLKAFRKMSRMPVPAGIPPSPDAAGGTMQPLPSPSIPSDTDGAFNPVVGMSSIVGDLQMYLQGTAYDGDMRCKRRSGDVDDDVRETKRGRFQVVE